MGLEHLAWLFTNDHRNRGICRLDFDEAALLYRMVQQTEGAILEIGRRHAGSTVLLTEASGGTAGCRHIVSIDINPAHHDLAEEYLQQTGLRKRISLVVGDSRQRSSLDASFGFAFIDGDHSYEGVEADIRAHWHSLQAKDGCPIVVFHDAIPNHGLDHVPGKLAHCPGVLQLCAELIASEAAKPIEVAASMLAVQKVKELPGRFPKLERAEENLIQALHDYNINIR